MVLYLKWPTVMVSIDVLRQFREISIMFGAKKKPTTDSVTVLSVKVLRYCERA